MTEKHPKEITLRQWYAGLVAPAVLATAKGDKINSVIVAQGAFLIADAMIAAEVEGHSHAHMFGDDIDYLSERLLHEVNMGSGTVTPLRIEAARVIESLRADLKEATDFIRNPPKHAFWAAGEADCPADIKAPNGELWRMRCKVCGAENPRSATCGQPAFMASRKDQGA